MQSIDVHCNCVFYIAKKLECALLSSGRSFIAVSVTLYFSLIPYNESLADCLRIPGIQPRTPAGV